MWVFPFLFSSLFIPMRGKCFKTIPYYTRRKVKIWHSYLYFFILFLFDMSCTFQSHLTRYVNAKWHRVFTPGPRWFQWRMQWKYKSFVIVYLWGNDSIFIVVKMCVGVMSALILAWIVSVQINVSNELINIRKWCVRLVIIYMYKAVLDI